MISRRAFLPSHRRLSSSLFLHLGLSVAVLLEFLPVSYFATAGVLLIVKVILSNMSYALAAFKGLLVHINLSSIPSPHQPF